MFFSFVRWAMRPVALLVLGLAFVPMVVIISAVAAGPIVHPRVSEWQFLVSGTTPPGQAACNAVGRRCFNPTARR